MVKQYENGKKVEKNLVPVINHSRNIEKQSNDQ